MWKTLCVWCGLHLIFLSRVEGIAMGIAPNNIIFSTTRVGNQALTTAFTCGSISTTDIKRINSLKMYRLSRKEEGSGTKTNIVSVYPNEAPTIESQDLVTAGATVEGSVVSNLEQNDFQAFVTLSIPTVKLICQDVGQYTCELNYENKAGVVVDPMQDSVNFTGYALADQVSLIGRPDAFNTGDGSETYPFQMKEGDVIEFTCSGRIGGDATTQWEWKKTGDTGNLIPLNPSSTMYQGRVNETKGPAVPVENECTNTRATKLRYTISSNDKNVAKAVQFQCYIDSQNSNISSPFIYVLVAGAINNNGGGTSGSTGPEASNAGMIAGVVVAAIVFIVIVVLLIYFLWYRRRGGGDTYKTREETDGSNPNLAPNAADLYAQPHKDRNKYGHENRGMEEREHENYHKKGRHRDDDYEKHRDRGRHNYAMDDDYESRDGGHPNDAPIGTGV